MKKYAHITLMTNEKFLKCILKNEERRKYLHYKYPSLVMVTKNISQAAVNELEDNGIKVISIPYLSFPNASPIFKDTLSKFMALSLEKYDKLLMMDADCINLINNEYLFDTDIGQYTFGVYKTIELSNPEKLNQSRIIAGVFLIQPNKILLDNILSNSIIQSCLNDEELFLWLDKQHQLFYLQNLKYTEYLHFGGPTKLWELKTVDKKLNEILEKLNSNNQNWLLDNHSNLLIQINTKWNQLSREFQQCFDLLEQYDTNKISK